MTDLRLPSITGRTTEEQVKQIKSYLYQLVQELNFALQAIEQAQSNTEE